MTGRRGMELFQEAMKEHVTTSVTCTTTMPPEENSKINLEIPDFSRIFALQTNI